VEERVSDQYLGAEARARVRIDKMLSAAGWAVQDYKRVSLAAGRGVAVREFRLKEPHGRADYLLFVDGRAVGAIEAKPAGTTLTEVEEQTAKYGEGLPDGVVPPISPLPFRYESTGSETRFTNFEDPDRRSRSLFWFHRPETFVGWTKEVEADPRYPTLRARFRGLPPVESTRLWPAQAEAIKNLDHSLAEDRPRALIQMATGSGKTYTAANVAYRLIKYAGARRILFLVDRANLGDQTRKEFQQFDTPAEGRKFTELYNIQHLRSNTIDTVSRVCISTVQRMYSILKGEAEMSPELDEHSLYELAPSQPVQIDYNPNVPIETFDVVIIDECHRSIYGLWRQVVEYFDAHLIGLTATPNKQAFGFFHRNLVMEYSHDKAVVDGVNVDYTVYRIRTEIGENGGTIDAGLVTGFRNRETRKVRWEELDDDVSYRAPDLDRRVVARDQIRTVIRTFRDKLFTEIFPGRTTVPKTLIFAKDDSHADDIVDVVREEFGKGNEFCQKITYRTFAKKPEVILQEFRNSLNPRIVVTVDMIATGTDVKPIECLIFMRDVKSRTYFEQMVGRGVRIINATDFQAVTPDARTKDRFVIVDAVGVTEKRFAETNQPLDRRPTEPLEKLMRLVSFGNSEPDVASTLAARLSRLDRQLTKEDREKLQVVAGGIDLRDIAHALVEAVDPDRQIAEAQTRTGRSDPTAAEVSAAATELIRGGLRPFAENAALREAIVDVRRSYEQMIDETSQDVVLEAGYSEEAKARAQAMIRDFRQFIEEHHNEIAALQCLYSRPYRQRPTYAQLKELANVISKPPHQLTPERLWRAYEALDKSKVRGSGGRMLTDIVSLVRYALEQEPQLVPFREHVYQRFEAWLARQAKNGRKFSQEQLQWLSWIKDEIAGEMGITAESFEFTPFVEHGGLGKAYQVFGDQLTPLMGELTEALAA
jgi:type I restriction enzyme, R subunit